MDGEKHKPHQRQEEEQRAHRCPEAFLCEKAVTDHAGHADDESQQSNDFDIGLGVGF